eukprot:3996138-Pyramimonas_sp.AAC.1
MRNDRTSARHGETEYEKLRGRMMLPRRDEAAKPMSSESLSRDIYFDSNRLLDMASACACASYDL